jgi:hypothetical protein
LLAGTTSVYRAQFAFAGLIQDRRCWMLPRADS